jgi:hypothetical protein
MNKPHRRSGETAPLDREALEAFWLPFTPNRRFKENPRLFVAAEGMQGRRACGIRWCRCGKWRKFPYAGNPVARPTCFAREGWSRQSRPRAARL